MSLPLENDHDSVIFIYMTLNYLTSENKNRENTQQNISYCIQKCKDDVYEFCQHEFHTTTTVQKTLMMG